jgi:DNA polymerase-3 subunit alpha
MIGRITELTKTVTKKKQEDMAFANLEDLDGKVKVVFFPRTWEKYQRDIADDVVLGFVGKVDPIKSAGDPTLLVEKILTLEELRSIQLHELHIQLSGYFTEESHIAPLRDFLFGVSGNGTVYLHIDVEGKSYVVKANNSVGVPATEEFVHSVQDIQVVERAWIV